MEEGKSGSPEGGRIGRKVDFAVVRFVVWVSAVVLGYLTYRWLREELPTYYLRLPVQSETGEQVELNLTGVAVLVGVFWLYSRIAHTLLGWLGRLGGSS